jgi:hypothetical protein
VPATTVAWLVLLMAVEGLLRGQIWAVLTRVVALVAIIVALNWLGSVPYGWRELFAVTFLGAGLLLLVVNLRDSWRR